MAVTGSPTRPVRKFVSSVQSEFAEERAVLRDYIRDDALMRRFFDAFLFEDVPASDRRPDHLNLDEVGRSDIYLGLFGSEYGSEEDECVSPTEREFDRATASGSHRLIFVKGVRDAARHPRMQKLIGKAQAGLIRKRFNTTAELVSGLYAALVEYLEAKDLIRWGPFDAAPCSNATLDDLDFERMTQFIRTARQVRQFPLAEGTPPRQLLEHLNLLHEGRLTNAAVLLESPVVSSRTRGQAGVQAGVQAGLEGREAALLRSCVQGATSKELQAAAGYAGRTRSFEQRLGRLLDEGLLEMTVPDKPKSPVQKYRLTDKGRAAIAPDR